MKWISVFRLIGAFLCVFGCVLLLMSLCAYLGERGELGRASGNAFSLVGLAFVGIGALRWLFPRSRDLGIREAILSVLAIWLLACLGGALPMYLGGMFDQFVDSFFEATSGLTTTGSTVIPMVGKTLSQCSTTLVYWRTLLAGIGGIGIMVLFVVLLPALGARGRLLFRYEATGPTFTPIYPTVRKSALAFLWLYLGAFFVCTVALHIVHPAISFFDSTSLAFSTISTAGFCPNDSGVSGYHSQALEIVLMVFMIIGAGSFALYFDLLRGRLKRFFDPELRTYLAIILGACVLGVFFLISTQIPGQEGVYSLKEAFHVSSFQLVACLTSTGYSLVNYDLWPQSIQMLMLIVMYIGGMSGSTAGGMKIIRLMMLWQCLKYSVQVLFDPDRIRVMKIDGMEIAQMTVFGVLSFFLVVVVSAVVGIMLLLMNGVDWITAMGLSAAMLNNAGVTFGAAGFLHGCSELPVVAKIISIAWMLLGRLEYYLWLTLLLPAFWRR